jgi:glyoxalase family protein
MASGLHVSNVIDRFWFKSIYFRVSNGILFEIATDGPGFAIDEDLGSLGEKLVLPPFLEARREEIEAGLTPIKLREPQLM